MEPVSADFNEHVHTCPKCNKNYSCTRKECMAHDCRRCDKCRSNPWHTNTVKAILQQHHEAYQ